MGRLWALATLLVAGCMTSAPGADLFAPAKDGLLAARQAAKQWDANAFLLRVHGVEPAAPDEALGALALRPDAHRGDGLAQAWEYLFLGKDGYYLVVVGADGRIAEAGAAQPSQTEGFSMFATRSLQEWRLDSDAAVPILRRHVPEWDLDAGAAEMVHWFLLPLEPSGVPHWLVGQEGAAGGRSYLLNVENASFEVADPIRLNGGGAVPAWEGDKQTLLLSAQQPNAQVPFSLVRDHHPSLVVGLRVDRATTGSVNLTLLKESQAVAWLDWKVNDTTGTKKAAALHWPATGPYQLTAKLTSLTPQSVEVFWCATGLPSGSTRTHACSYL